MHSRILLTRNPTQSIVDDICPLQEADDDGASTIPLSVVESLTVFASTRQILDDAGLLHHHVDITIRRIH